MLAAFLNNLIANDSHTYHLVGRGSESFRLASMDRKRISTQIVWSTRSKQPIMLDSANGSTANPSKIAGASVSFHYRPIPVWVVLFAPAGVQAPCGVVGLRLHSKARTEVSASK